jgi:Tol biopolymer transport system component
VAPSCFRTGRRGDGGLIGQTLSHYRVTAALGAGGMGEVYRATDTHLHRDVAIKVLPPEVAQDPERLGRFQREAHLLAALNHPNIAAIYGLEEADGKPFLALELVEGEDLKERLSRGAIPVDEALEIARQIAEALEEAHGKGIVHRDLKPANVKLTPDGKVKVLDFGLAKAWGGDTGSGGSSIDLSQSPTIARTGTLAGVILGTAAYMSPEQASGRAVDKRADVWSFGVVLFEMLTGRALFSGETVSEIMASVIKEEPSWERLPAGCPPAIERLLRRCLRKKPRERLQDIGDARVEIQEVQAGTTGEATAPSPDVEAIVRAGRRSRTRERWAWAALTLLTTGLAAGFAFVHFAEKAERPPAVRLAADLPEGWSFADFGWPVPSPDGRQVVFVARPDTAAANAASAMLWMRSLESLAVRPLAGTEGASYDIPVWSPDSRSVAFFAGGELRRLNLADATVQRICSMPAPGNGGADWSREGTILFSAGGGAGRIYAVPATGGDARPLTTFDASRAETSHHVPQFLPDGRRFLLTIDSNKGENDGLYVASLDAPDQRRQVVPGWLHYAYAAGHLVFARDGTLFAQPFDAARGERTGEPVAIASSVGSWVLNSAVGLFGVSPAGTLATIPGGDARGQVQLAWVDRKGGRIGTVGAPGTYGQIALSPDERSVALEIWEGGTSDLWVMDVARGVTSRLTATPGMEIDPVWAPDGRSLAFAAVRDGKEDLRRRGLRANDPEIVLLDAPGQNFPESWSRDGRTIALCRLETDGKQGAWALTTTGDGKAEAIVAGPFRVDEPQISPDGQWVAYVSSESGRDEVYVEPFRREGDRVRVSVDGGGQPKWRGDGRELFLVTGNRRLQAVTVRPAGDRVDVTLPTDLFELRVFQGTYLDDYAPSADGQRFLVKLPLVQSRKPQLHIVTNWTSLLPTATR